MEIPRLYNKERERTEGLANYNKIKSSEISSEKLMSKILFGLSQKNYSEVARTTTENHLSVKGLLSDLIKRNFKFTERNFWQICTYSKVYLA